MKSIFESNFKDGQIVIQPYFKTHKTSLPALPEFGQGAQPGFLLSRQIWFSWHIMYKIDNIPKCIPPFQVHGSE